MSDYYNLAARLTKAEHIALETLAVELKTTMAKAARIAILEYCKTYGIKFPKLDNIEIKT